MTVLNLLAKQDYLEKIARTADPIKGLAEFVWNALDANATTVSVEFLQNPLGGIQDIIIKDNGIGITAKRAEEDFKSLGDSWKRKATRKSGERALHGKEGKGRLQFFSIAEKAEWKSVYKDKNTFWDLSIEIRAELLSQCDVSEPTKSQATSSGTTVTLSPLKAAYDWLLSEEALTEFSVRFASYLMKYSDVSLSYNGRKINPTANIHAAHDFPVKILVAPGRTIKDLSLKVIEWKSHVESRKIHLGGESGIVLGSQAAHVQAPGFEYSAYANSSFFQEMADINLLELDDLSDPDFKYVMDHIREELGEYFRRRQVDKSKGLIEELISSGAYPYSGEPENEIERRERQVFDIATYAVSSYSKDFKKAETSLKKMTLTLLKEALRNNPDTLTNILRAVIKLPKARQDEFSNLLDKTELSNIITASNLIADRVTTLRTLSSIVFDPEHRKTIKERGQLDVIVRDNTWLFGELFHITLHEAGLTKVMDRVSEELGNKRKKGKVTKKSGKKGRIDCFLGRSMPNPDGTKREYLVVELKRPSIKTGRKELDQLEDYVAALKSQPDFNGTNTTWHFYLVTGEYDATLEDRVRQKDRPPGLYIEKENFKVWVKTWAELIRECEGRLKFVQDHLKIDVSNDVIEQQIALLKKSILKDDDAKEN